MKFSPSTTYIRSSSTTCRTPTSYSRRQPELRRRHLPKLKLDGDVIADGAFVGDGCAVSQASADIMLGMIVGKKKEDALKMGDIFLKMIQGEASEDEIDSLEEASALRDIAHMPARVKCAVLGWRTLKEALLDGDELS